MIKTAKSPTLCNDLTRSKLSYSLHVALIGSQTDLEYLITLV